MEGSGIMMSRRKYSGTVEWHTEPPKRSGVYLCTWGGGNVSELKYVKKGKNWVWETYYESEMGGFMEANVKAWAYFPEPYKE